MRVVQRHCRRRRHKGHSASAGGAGNDGGHGRHRGEIELGEKKSGDRRGALHTCVCVCKVM